MFGYCTNYVLHLAAFLCFMFALPLDRQAAKSQLDLVWGLINIIEFHIRHRRLGGERGETNHMHDSVWRFIYSQPSSSTNFRTYGTGNYRRLISQRHIWRGNGL